MTWKYVRGLPLWMYTPHIQLVLYRCVHTYTPRHKLKHTNNIEYIRGGSLLSSAHTYTHTYTVDSPLSTPRSFIVSGMKDSEWLVWNPTQSSYTVMCCFAPWSSLSGASINRAIVRSALPKGFTPISSAMWLQSPFGLTFHCWSPKQYGDRGQTKGLIRYKPLWTRVEFYFVSSFQCWFFFND